MQPATSTEIANLLGDIEPIFTEQILETGATLEEVTQAFACFEADREGEVQIPMSTRVAAVYTIIEDALDDLDEGSSAVG